MAEVKRMMNWCLLFSRLSLAGSLSLRVIACLDYDYEHEHEKLRRDSIFE